MIVVKPNVATRRYIAHLLNAKNTLHRDLCEDPESGQYYPNRESRPVWSGHYVKVKPDPITKPLLLAYNRSTARELGIDQDVLNSVEFLKIMSGDVSSYKLEPWACGYAVSVLGNEILDPCGYGGQAYGDGRAISLGELQKNERKWEIQLKGAGTTPFSRNFDGRAVLRSSVREFLASHAMFHLGVPTTRSLSLIVSKDMHVQRMWYEDDISENKVTKRKYAPNRIVQERCAIASRVSTSFLRVGTVELFARRARRKRSEENEVHRTELTMLLDYALRTEFSELKRDVGDYVGILEVFAKRQARLVTEWLRVGYVQGNMNSDNALLNGQTLDYGPFAFLERYEKTWTPFTSDPQQNAGFERQPLAAHLTVLTLARALAVVCSEKEVEKLENIVNNVFPDELEICIQNMRCEKLGLERHNEAIVSKLWSLLDQSDVDYTIFWRLLYDSIKKDHDVVPNFDCIEYAFYEEPPSKTEWNDWLSKWKQEIVCETAREKMRVANPKYIPREWMLVKAYEDAENGDYEELRNLQKLLENPYESQSKESEAKYFQKTPKCMRNRPGVSFYS